MTRKTDEIRALKKIISTLLKFDDVTQKRIIENLVDIYLQLGSTYSTTNLKDSVKNKPAPRKKRRIRSDTTEVPKKKRGRPSNASKKISPESK